MFSKYYQSELAYLREIGKAFGLANPAAAGMLAERSGDPDVERLLEGVAFLTARIREKIDDSVPEVIHQLADLVFPHFLRAQPAASLIEFSPNMAAMRGRLSIPRGSEVQAKPAQKTACKFRTTQQVDIVPASIVDVVLDRTSKNNPQLRLLFECSEGAREAIAQPKKKLRLYLHGELALTATLRLWLLRYCEGVCVRGENGREVQLPSGAVHPVGFSDDEALVPWPDFAPRGLHFLQEYFSLPEKFLFLDIAHLDRAGDVLDERFEIVFQLNHPPDLPGELHSSSIRLHCTPVINLFESAADPISLSTFSRERIVRASSIDPNHMEVYSIDEVIGIQPGRRERRTYERFFDFSHAAPTGEQAYYQAAHRQSPINDGLDLFLSVNSPRDVIAQTSDEVLSLSITCTNRSLPAELRVGDICNPGPTIPSIVKFRNIIPVTMPVRPPLGSELHWRLISHLAMNFGTLAKAETLRAVCNLYNFQDAADHSAGYTNRRRSDGIREIRSKQARRILQGAPLRGVATTIELNSANYAGIGEAELFGAILNEILAARVGINSFHELAVDVQPFSIEFKWPARNGQLAIL